jgi:iron complex outermembrane receptor protein
MGSYCAQNVANFGDIQPKQSRVGTYGRFTIKPNDNFEAYVGQLHAEQDLGERHAR